MHKFIIPSIVLVVIILLGLGVSFVLINNEKKRATELTQTALPGYGDPLVVDGSSTSDNNVLSQLSPKKDEGPTKQELQSYQQYAASKQLLQGDIKVGQGVATAANMNVAVSYKGYLTTGQLFDQTTDKPFVVKIGERKVIPGFEQGLVGMKVGGKRRLIIPPSLGYGDKVQGPIPASSVLVFDIELLDSRPAQ